MEVTEKDNVVDNGVPPSGPPPASVVNQAGVQEPPRKRLIDVEVTDETVALNVLVGFLNVAQRRGVFDFYESAKIGECINQFVRRDQEITAAAEAMAKENSEKVSSAQNSSAQESSA